MVVDQDARELGQLIGANLKAANNYKQDFLESDILTSIGFTNIHTLGLTGSFFVNKVTVEGNFVLGHSVYGVLGTSRLGHVAVYGHPVYGIMGSSNIYASAVYSSALFQSGVL